MLWRATFVVASIIALRSAAAADFSATGVALLERWTATIRNHTAGRLDPSIEVVTAFTYQDRLLLDGPMWVFLSVLSGSRYEPETELQQRVYRLALASRAEFGHERFLKRAALLHTDVAIAAESDRRPPLDPRTVQSTPKSPLFDTRAMTINGDGEIRGETESDWNWPFARSLVGSLHQVSPIDPFAADWYHATTAFMYARLSYAEASAHLAAAAKILPDDPRILFDRGTLADVQSLPINQVLLDGIDLIAFRQLREGRKAQGGVSDATRAAAALGLPLKEEALEDAERQFRRTLRIDPALAEARVRLARVLLERERYREALTEATTALAGNPPPVVAFYGHLFGGRAAQSVGRYDSAAAHFDAALALFPRAQSAMLARSQLALLGADVRGAVTALGRLPQDPHPDVPADDPWAYYRLATGRDWSSVYRALRIQ